MNTHTKPCQWNGCDGTGWYNIALPGDADFPFLIKCSECKGTGRVPDVEATLRAENETLRRQLDALAGGQADGVLALARTLADAETAMLRAELDAARAEAERLTTQRDAWHGSSAQWGKDCERLTAENDRLRAIIRHNDPAVVGVCSPLVDAELDKRDAEIARLRGEVERLAALYRKADDGHDENMRETARLIGEVERLKARERDRVTAARARTTRAARPLSQAEQNARKPLSPLVLLGASEETIHTDRSDGVTHDGEVPTC